MRLSLTLIRTRTRHRPALRPRPSPPPPPNPAPIPNPYPYPYPGTYLLCDLAVSVDNGVAWYWYLGDAIGILLWTYSVYSVLREVVDLWLEAALQAAQS